MRGASSLALEPYTLLQLAWTCLVAFIAGALFLFKRTATWSFAVNGAFEGNEEFRDRHMPIGSGGSAVGVGVSECPVCTRSASKKCSRCKSVWYCSQECQSKHWNAEHKSKCKEFRSADKFDTFGTGARRKSSAISLVPEHGTRKVLKEPKKILFPYDEFVKLFDWDKPNFPPCGLLNCGNSCFANVILQCLACTRPLVAYLFEKDHYRGCLRRRDDWCFLCELQIHLKRASESSTSFSPINILSRLPNIGGNLGYGRQEDAHEFMRFAIDTMQSICLDDYGGEKAVDPSTQETTIVQYIFGGHLRSQVKCTNCDVVSNRYENMMDLTVEIHGDSESLEECLDQFTVKECLDGENMYKCDGCNDYVKAWKRLTVHQAPNVLTIALKRFQSGRFGKLNKRVTFPENLDLTPYMSANGDGTDHYTLYGVVVHLDMLNASFFGHYICYTKDYRGLWYKIDDCKVTKVEVEEVLAQGAYMLLYHRRNPRKDPFVKPIETATKTCLAEINPAASRPQDTTKSSTFDILSSTPFDNESKPNILHSETSSEFSTLRDTGHDRLLIGCSGNESEDMDLYSPAVETTNLEPKIAQNFIFDNSFTNPSGVNNLKLENSNPLENNSSIKSSPSRASNPANFSSAEVRATESEEMHSYSDADLHLKESNGSISFNETSEISSTDKDIIMAEASTAPILSSSTDQGPEPSANGVCTSDISLESETHSKTSMDSPRPKLKLIFTRGFLDKPVHKKPSGHKKTVQMEENQGASISSKPNGYSNGHSKFGGDIEMTDGNGDDYMLSSDSNTASISPSFSNGSPRDHARAECNGLSSYYKNETEEFKPPEISCSDFETAAGICNSSSYGDGFGFEMKSSYGSDIKTSRCKTSECYPDESQRLKPINGFSTADFSD